MGILVNDRNVKILLYGDSIAKGIVYDESSNKYKKEGSCFFNILSGKMKATLENVSKFGNTLIRASRKFDEDLSKHKPDIAVIEFGGNDCDFCWEQVAENPYDHHSPNTPPEEFETLLTDFIHRMREQSIQPVIFTMPPIDPIRYFKWICQGKPSYEKNILTFLGTENTIYRWHEKYNLMLLEIAAANHIPVIDIRKSFLCYLDIGQFLCKDGIHPNQKGHKLIADTVMNHINLHYPQLAM
ncbi:MAG TPA: G-D-S-L family lipolytic protein [Clostridiales bacterium]|nr:G-D-S-L family lipolytic protein [Clostridiales bacterium]